MIDKLTVTWPSGTVQTLESALRPGPHHRGEEGADSVPVLCVAASILPLCARDEGLVAYPSPIEMAIAANGRRLYVVCEGTDEVVELDPVAGVVRGASAWDNIRRASGSQPTAGFCMWPTPGATPYR